MKRLWRFLTGTAVMLLLLACGKEPGPVAGGWTDTETGTKISGVIRGEGGSVAANARIALRPSDWLARNPAQPDSTGPRTGRVLDTYADGEGRYAFDSVPAGAYLIEARMGGQGALIPCEALERSLSLELPPASLGPLAAIRGRVLFSDGQPGRAVVRVYGLERAVMADPATGTFSVDSVPAGTLALHASGLEPFILPVKKGDVDVAPPAPAEAGDILLQRKLKQAFRITDGFVDIPGVDSTNPVIFENGSFQNPVDGAYLWAKASLGRLDLRGTIVTYGKDTGEAEVQANLRRCRALVQSARASGLRNVLDPVAGARRRLVAAPSGRLEDIEPAPTQGGLLLIQEAYRAKADKPLIVISGAGLSTVAEALLRDPAIANRMVIFCANSGNLNDADSLAAAVVSKKARLVQWARDYYWDNSALTPKPAEVYPTHRMGLALSKQWSLASTSPYWAYSYFADFGAATYLFNRKVWTGAKPGNFKIGASPAPMQPPDDDFDYVDIPREANDWLAMMEEFYATVLDPKAYHPWTVPGDLDGGAFTASLRAGPAGDPTAPGAGTMLMGRGSWADYAVNADSAGDYSVMIRARSDAPAALSIGETAAGTTGSVQVLPTVEAATHTVTLRLVAGTHVLRLESTRSAITVEGLRFERIRP